MSGGIAYVLDPGGTFAARCNMELVGFDEIDETDAIELHELIEEHHLRTLSPVAARILEDWEAWLPALRQGHAARLQARARRHGRGRARDATPRTSGDAVADPVGVPHTGTPSRQS